MKRILRKTIPSLLVLASLGQSVFAADEKKPERALDLQYGKVLFEFYQQRYYGALTDISIGELRNNITHHGDHPQVLKGGMLLSYGMVDEARRIFENLLEGKVTPEVRNQAWFYLGKVYYQMRKWENAKSSFQRVDRELLEDSDSELLEEYFYLQGQTALGLEDLNAAEEFLQPLPKDSYWRAYLDYNLALNQRKAGDLDAALRRLASVSAPTPQDEDDPNEFYALSDRISLTTGVLRMEQNDYAGAMTEFRKVRINGPWSDQALFGYALAASNSGEFGLAIQSLQTLSSKQAANPIIQESHFAIGYVYEQLGQKVKALNAYANAVTQYQESLRLLETNIAELDEDRLFDSLEFGGDPELHITRLDDDNIRVDEYGRLDVRPATYSLAHLVAQEEFQRVLKELRELTLLQNTLNEWLRKVDSFDVMIDTRKIAREERIRETREKMTSLDADRIRAQRDALAQVIAEGETAGDGAYFLTEDQLGYKAIIERSRRTIELMRQDPDWAEDVPEYEEKLRRMEGFLNWTVSEEFPQRLWEAKQELAALDTALKEYSLRSVRINNLIAKSESLETLEQRVDSAKPRLQELSDQVRRALTRAKTTVSDMARDELLRQRDQVNYYMTSAKLARTRLSDELLDGEGGGL
ncbi:tetratricopeptide repeat protein [Hahella sp. KA22]|uniref:tetratricopeptide repeat protein n=1 Tax=Hahella sp. KA22 TaxID=1628392 RepID=UPI000FDD3918|nr:tetratricopeptide repeat protein [Hahella sp. KA22]AZZ93098.1 tetratricopeptide repeat protein [Hahella sp. KA22]QAY56472.1 tetratricopeptide repeat protein [Hahella sp. KA22]